MGTSWFTVRLRLRLRSTIRILILTITRVPQPAEVLAPYFLNQSCNPYTPQSTPCTLGNYVSYSINVTGVNDFIAGVNFARAKNIRLVIKNTGHECAIQSSALSSMLTAIHSLLGKSTGKGGLALWTHNLNSIDIISTYDSSYYHGPAIKVGAGVMGGDAAVAASQQGYRIVVGSCPTVGAAGGYAQGGGHSLLTGLYGLAADNVLEWEVVTADGKHVMATPTQNADLYWALSGGGGGTYGVVVSMTTRLFKEGPVGRAALAFSAASTGSNDSFWKALDVFHSHLQPIVDTQGIVVTYILANQSLNLFTVTAPNRTADEVAQIFAPMTSALGELGLSLQTLKFTAASADTFHKHYLSTLEPVLAVAPAGQVTSGRIISRENLAANTAGIGSAMRTTTASGHFSLLCTAVNTQAGVAPVTKNSVQPAWHQSLVSCVVTGTWDWSIPWDEMLRRQDELTNVVDPALEAVTPGSGTYMNEANFQRPGWQNAFYGTNYGRLRAIKKRWDPKDLFYGITAVGSEAWTADSDGRLCRSSTISEYQYM